MVTSTALPLAWSAQPHGGAPASDNPASTCFSELPEFHTSTVPFWRPMYTDCPTDKATLTGDTDARAATRDAYGAEAGAAEIGAWVGAAGDAAGVPAALDSLSWAYNPAWE